MKEAELFINDTNFTHPATNTNFINPTTNTNFINPVIESNSLSTQHINVYTDGSCISGIGGYGLVIVKDGSHEEYFGRVPHQPSTNNISELFAIKMALEKIKGDIKIYSDSEYSINVITGRKKAHKNLELLSEIKECMRNRNVIFEHVRAHRGNTYNEIADKIANEGRNCEINL